MLSKKYEIFTKQCLLAEANCGDETKVQTKSNNGMQSTLKECIKAIAEKMLFTYRTIVKKQLALFLVGGI